MKATVDELETRLATKANTNEVISLTRKNDLFSLKLERIVVVINESLSLH
jgi:hypothetical protein